MTLHPSWEFLVRVDQSETEIRNTSGWRFTSSLSILESTWIESLSQFPRMNSHAAAQLGVVPHALRCADHGCPISCRHSLDGVNETVIHFIDVLGEARQVDDDASLLNVHEPKRNLTVSTFERSVLQDQPWWECHGHLAKRCWWHGDLEHLEQERIAKAGRDIWLREERESEVIREELVTAPRGDKMNAVDQLLTKPSPSRPYLEMGALRRDYWVLVSAFPGLSRVGESTRDCRLPQVGYSRRIC